MKIIHSSRSITILLLFMAACSQRHHVNTEDEEQRDMVLKNKIKSITEYLTESHLGIKQKEVPGHLQTFDENGFKTREITYKADGSIDCIMTYMYDKTGNMTGEKAVNQDSNLMFRKTMSYHDNKNRKELFFYLPDGTYKYRNVAAYDDKGRMKELAWYWPDGFKSKNTYSYDGGKKTEDIETGAKGEFRYRWIFKYDSRGNSVEAVQFYPGNVINSKITYEYDNSNRMIKKTSYFGESVQNIISYEYGKNDLFSARIESSPNGMNTASYRYQYEFY